MDSRSVWRCSSSITLARSSLVSPLSVINSSNERSPPRQHTRSTGSITPEYVFGGFASTATTFSKSRLSDGTSTNLSVRTSVFVTPRFRRYSSYSSFLSQNEVCVNQPYIMKFKTLMVAAIQITVFWNMTPCSLVQNVIHGV